MPLTGDLISVDDFQDSSRLGITRSTQFCHCQRIHVHPSCLGDKVDNSYTGGEGVCSVHRGIPQPRVNCFVWRQSSTAKRRDGHSYLEQRAVSALVISETCLRHRTYRCARQNVSPFPVPCQRLGPMIDTGMLCSSRRCPTYLDYHLKATDPLDFPTQRHCRLRLELEPRTNSLRDKSARAAHVEMTAGAPPATLVASRPTSSSNAPLVPPRSSADPNLYSPQDAC